MSAAGDPPNAGRRPRRPKVLIVGKLPPPYFGPAIATEIILGSKLKDDFRLIHLNNGINTSIATMGKGSIRKLWLNLLIYLRFTGLLLRHRPGLVLIPISQTTPGFLKDSVLIWIAAIFRRRILIQLRGSNFRNWQAQSSKLIRTYTRVTCRRANGVIVLGRKLVHLFEGYFREDQIHVVPNGADYRLEKASREDERTRIIYLANMLESKGINDVVEAMLTVEGERPGRAALDVVGMWGDAGLREFCESFVSQYRLPVSFHPPAGKQAKMRMLAAADLFVFPPREPEGHPWVIIEAMASSLPIISTDQGAIGESVIHGANGFLVEPHSPAAIAQRIIELIDAPELCRQMGARSRKIYEQGFTEEVMVGNLRKVFLKVMGR